MTADAIFLALAGASIAAAALFVRDLKRSKAVVVLAEKIAPAMRAATDPTPLQVAMRAAEKPARKRSVKSAPAKSRAKKPAVKKAGKGKR